MWEGMPWQVTVFAAHLPYKPTEKADQIYYKYMMQCVYDGWVVGNACTCFFMYVYIYIYMVSGELQSSIWKLHFPVFPGS